MSHITSTRSYAVDLFRGLTIFAMILVNNPGSWSHLYAPLAHAKWHGWTVTDLIFPFFLIIVGIAIRLSFKDGSKSQLSLSEKHQEIIIRSLKLYGLGLLLGLFYYQFHNPDFSWVNDKLMRMRLVGVLHRIALVYLVSTLIFVHVKSKYHGLWFVALLTLYWSLMMLVSYPVSSTEFHQGLLLSGDNLAAYLDHNIIGQAHLYLKNTLPFASDPEGLLSTLPAIASCIGGFFIADILKSNPQPLTQAKQLLLMSIAALILAYAIEYWIPFNKNLWTPSYVLLAQGFACLILAVTVVITDHLKWRKGTKPLIVFGMNAIALFVLSGIVARIFLMVRVDDISLKTWLYQWFTMIPVAEKTQSLLFAISFLILMYLPLYWMYQRKYFWKV